MKALRSLAALAALALYGCSARSADARPPELTPASVDAGSIAKPSSSFSDAGAVARSPGDSAHDALAPNSRAGDASTAVDSGNAVSTAGQGNSAVTGDTWPTQDWSSERPEDHGMDSDLLKTARDYAFADGRNTQGIVVVRGGVIVAEWYADGSDAQSPATSWSVGKSFASALVGIAIDEGLIENVDVSMAKFFPSWAGTDKEKIRLRDVLQQTSGLKWNEHYDPLNLLDSDVIQITFQDGTELSFAADRDLAQAPGTTFNYSSGNAMLLSEVLRVATGMQAHEYARKKLFEPLGMSKAEWWRGSNGQTLTFCCVDATSRDFARFGLLYARGGVWRDRTLISRAWIQQSVAPSARAGYGYQWWLLGKQDQEGPPDSTEPEPSTLPPDLFAAIGVDMQLIYIVPQLDLVVVRNGTYHKDSGEAVAMGGLFFHIPPEGLSSTLGTVGPNSWRHDEFMHLVLAALH